MRGPRLIVLDDDQEVGAIMARVALSIGGKALAVRTPDAFFARLSEWGATHVAIDLALAEYDGIDVLHRLARTDARPVVVLVSGLGARVLDAAGRLALELGLPCARPVEKPFRVETFRRALRDSPDLGGVSGAVATRPTAAMLRDALGAGEIAVRLQPIVSCADGALTGVEALAEWRRPAGGLVAPVVFVEVAEQSGLIDALTQTVFTRALDWLASPLGAGAPGVSLNASMTSLADRGFVDRLAQLCAVRRIDPARVTIEVTETCAIREPVATLALLTRLRVRGFRLAIDDFGAGHASIAHLARLPFSDMKIDRRFVTDARGSDEADVILRAMVGLGRNLGLNVTGEGVETAAEMARLRDVGCHHAQGYHIAPAMDCASFGAWAAGHAPSLTSGEAAPIYPCDGSPPPGPGDCIDR